MKMLIPVEIPYSRPGGQQAWADQAAPKILRVRVCWDRTEVPLRIADRFWALHFGPEPGYPAGRKGLALARAWAQLAPPDADGMLLLDGDVAIDPEDFKVMLTQICGEPGAVHTAPVRLWPVSTRLSTWVWGHGTSRRYSQDDPDEGIDIFTFCFTYLPAALIGHCIEAGLEDWAYPRVDGQVSAAAARLSLPVRVARGARPVHLNY